ncbi:DUF4835 family protein [uncultured Bacteroides sp.]|uniref:type IX secretion system protein PorD n=1 Tax=uncultured Bacteroides sp. TaxID=162156 RepID=UPI003747C48D
MNNKIIQNIFRCICFSFLIFSSFMVKAQELNCKVNINYSQIQGTNTQVFKTLETALTEFINDRKWTSAQYGAAERISCSMNITLKQHTDDGAFKCELIVQANRPVFDASYNTTLFNFKDVNFNFTYLEFDPLELRENQIDSNLTAVIAYYAYLIIGMDRDSMAPMGGTEVLRTAESIVTAAQSLSETGWKAFEDSRNRHGIITDYLDENMKPFRQMIYDYHRLGLDEMAQNADRGRTQITTSLEELKKAKENKPMSVLPQLFTEIKKDELVNVYSKGTQSEKEQVYNMLVDINPAQSNDWDKIKSSK